MCFSVWRLRRYCDSARLRLQARLSRPCSEVFSSDLLKPSHCFFHPRGIDGVRAAEPEDHASLPRGLDESGAVAQIDKLLAGSHRREYCSHAAKLCARILFSRHLNPGCARFRRRSRHGIWRQVSRRMHIWTWPVWSECDVFLEPCDCGWDLRCGYLDAVADVVATLYIEDTRRQQQYLLCVVVVHVSKTGLAWLSGRVSNLTLAV